MPPSIVEKYEQDLRRRPPLAHLRGAGPGAPRAGRSGARHRSLHDRPRAPFLVDPGTSHLGTVAARPGRPARRAGPVRDRHRPRPGEPVRLQPRRGSRSTRGSCSAKPCRCWPVPRSCSLPTSACAPGSRRPGGGCASDRSGHSGSAGRPRFPSRHARERRDHAAAPAPPASDVQPARSGGSTGGHPDPAPARAAPAARHAPARRPRRSALRRRPRPEPHPGDRCGARRRPEPHHRLRRPHRRPRPRARPGRSCVPPPVPLPARPRCTATRSPARSSP